MKTYLFGSACASALAAAFLGAGTAVASDQPASGSPSKAAVSPSAGGDPEVQGAPVTQSQDIVVEAHTNRSSMAGGGMIAIQETPVVRTTIGQAFIAKQIPAQNALSAVRLAPGADVGQDNPYGISERSDLTVRGIDQTQMGFVVGGVPAGDPGNYLPNTNEWIDNENIQSVSLTQGTSDLSSPVLSASGGLISVEMRDPSHSAGGTLSLSGGSHNANREFIRLESGDIGNSGIRATGSFSYINADNFRGPGDSTRDHVDFKALKEWGEGNRAALVVQYNHLLDYRESIPTLAQFQTLGKNSNYASTYTFGTTSYYKLQPYFRNTLAVSTPTNIQITRNLNLNTTPYFRYMVQGGPGGTQLKASDLYYGNQQILGALGNVPYSQGGVFVAGALAHTVEYHGGVNTILTYKAGNNEIVGGFWYDYLWEHQLSGYVGADQFGNLSTITAGGVVTYSNGVTVAGVNTTIRRSVESGYIGDNISLFDGRLKILAGIKVVHVDVTGNNFLPGTTNPVIGVTTNNVTPRLGATYNIGDHGQVFFDLVTNARPPAPITSYEDVFSVATGKETTAGVPNAKSERSFQQEIGFRYQGTINFSIAGFHNRLTNHQVNTIVNQGGALVQSIISVGTESIYGVDGELGLRPFHNFSPYIAGQYLKATTDSDFAVGQDFLPTKGKTAVRSPKFIGSAGLTYDDGSLFATISEKYSSSQYSTFMNNQSLPGYSQLDLGIGYRLPNIAFAKRPTIQLNISNALNDSHLGSVASPTGTAVATVGRNGTLIAASQPSYYENSTFIALFTIKSDF